VAQGVSPEFKPQYRKKKKKKKSKEQKEQKLLVLVGFAPCWMQCLVVLMSVWFSYRFC
jgi:hypothetical protein